MSDLFELETDRLVLRSWSERHRGPMAELNADPEVMLYFPSTYTVEQTNAAIDRWQSQIAERGWGFSAAELRGSGEFIGMIGLSVPRNPLPCSPCVEIGWRLLHRHWGQGYATEGANACLGFGFANLRLSEIVAFTALTNARSRAVMERIGMTNANADFEHPGVPEGNPLRMHCLYKVTREEWERQGTVANRPAAR
jgi:RimJ/RimL family protein N-acetyltransferase